MPTTTRLALPYPAASDTADVPRDMGALATKLDPGTAIFVQGTAGTRPAAGTAGRLHYATDTGVLSYDTGSAWVALVAPLDRVKVYRNAALSTTTAVALTIPFDTAVPYMNNTAGMWAAGAPTRLTAVNAGLYHIFGNTEFGVNGTGTRGLHMQKSGVAAARPGQAYGAASPATLGTRLAVSTFDYLVAGDYVELLAYQNSGGNLPLTVADAYTTTFGMVRLGG